jgi:hypothetical protein
MMTAVYKDISSDEVKLMTAMQAKFSSASPFWKEFEQHMAY